MEARVLEALFKVEAMASDMGEMKVTLKEMASAISRLALIEDRQVHDRAEITRVFGALKDLNTRVRTLEDAQPLQKQAADWVSRGVWAVVAAVISGASGFFVAAKTAERAPVSVPYLSAPAR